MWEKIEIAIKSYCIDCLCELLFRHEKLILGMKMKSYLTATHSAFSELRSVLRLTRRLSGLVTEKDGSHVAVFEDGQIARSNDGFTWTITPPGLWKPDGRPLLHRA